VYALSIELIILYYNSIGLAVIEIW